jgi:uncharacterized protein YbbC (DUF1343 family)/CubicO group peptidase (beta-lactamase class C family)
MDTDKNLLRPQYRHTRLRSLPLAFIINVFLIGVYLCSSVVNSSAQGLPLARPETVGMNGAKLNQIDALVEADIAAKKLPGAVVLVGHKGKIVFRKAYGNRSLVPTVEKMTVDTIFDVASLTKPIATATSIMILVEQGKLRLNDTVGMYIPDIDDPQAKRVTIQQLLTHTSGYRPDFDLGEKWTGREGMLAALKKEKLRAAPGTRFVYSDIGFIVLGEILERIGLPGICPEKTISAPAPFPPNCEERFSKNNIFTPMGMSASRFFRLSGISVEDINRDRTLIEKVVAPTENVRGQNSYLGSTFAGDPKIGDQILRGAVHDPTSFRMGGVAGHAGLFSTADDLARYCQMLLNGGTLDGKRVMSAQTISRMTSPYIVSESGDARGLGWDINTSFSGNRGDLFPLGSFGHTGFTGTSVWIDRVSQTFYVFLSNRVHPDGKGDVGPLRAKVATVVASAVEDTPFEKYKQAEAEYNAAVAAQLPRFKEQVEAATRATENSTIISTGNPQLLPASRTNFGQLVLLRNPVLNGIDILERDKFKQLEGLKIGLVTNHTGRNLAGKQTIDILAEAKNVKLTAMFAPEHGIRGELDTEKIDDSKDEKTGLPIYSLYKDGMRRPKPEQTATIDAFVYDIQDIGARFYTYTATLKNVMEEAAKAGTPVFVLDRPNPINGNAVEGSLADEDKLNFIAPHTVPVRYGMTIGEYAQLMNAERKIGADLRVIKMEGWQRSMWFDETGQTWVNPSPNMRSLTQATLYPGIGLLETTNLSVGRGTDTPFEVIGAPYIDGQKLAAYLNGRNIKGVRFIPIRYKPNASVFKDEQVGGVNMVITDRNALNSYQMGIEIAAALRKLYPNDWQVDRYGRLLVNAEFLDMVKRGETPENIEKAVNSKSSDFTRRRAAYLLYK